MKAKNKNPHTQFVKNPTEKSLISRNEVRFGLPRTYPNVKPVETVKPDVTEPPQGGWWLTHPMPGETVIKTRQTSANTFLV